MAMLLYPSRCMVIYVRLSCKYKEFGVTGFEFGVLVEATSLNKEIYIKPNRWYSNQ
jgi:hypothetical protein